MRGRKTQRQRSIKDVRVTTFEVLSDGQNVPVYDPVQHSKRIKTRKYREALGKYSKDLWGKLQKGYRLTHVEDISVGPQATDEERLMRYTHRLFVLEKSGEEPVKCVVPCNNRSSQRHTNISTEKRFQHRYVCDDNAIAIVSFTSANNSSNESNFHFIITFIDFYTLHVTKHENIIRVNNKENIRFDLIFSRGILCAVWIDDDICSTWRFQDDTSKFFQFNINENMSEAYHFTLDHEYLIVITKDEDFFDSVFASDDSSQRMTSYYSCVTGETFTTKSVITQVLQQDPLQHVSDILFLNIPSNPKWMILEWLLPEMTLSHVVIYKQNEDNSLEKEGVFNFQNDFSEYKTYFGKLNELQCKVFISRSPWRAFLWISWNHVIIIDLSNYEIVGILRTDLSKFKDFKNELHDFQLEVSRTAHRVTLFVKRLTDVVHFCRFNLVPTLTLKQLAMKKVVDNFSYSQISQLQFSSNAFLKAQILDAY